MVKIKWIRLLLDVCKLYLNISSMNGILINSHYQDLFLVSQFKTPTQAPCLQSPRMKDNKAHNYATILRRYSARFTQITFHCAYIAFKETGICAAELYIKFTLSSECKALSLYLTINYETSQGRLHQLY